MTEKGMEVENEIGRKEARESEGEKEEIEKKEIEGGKGEEIEEVGKEKEGLEEIGEREGKEEVVEAGEVEEKEGVEKEKEELEIVKKREKEVEEAKEVEEEIKEEEKEVEIIEEGGYVTKQKPEIDVNKGLLLRKEIKSRKPSFRRQEGFRYDRLGNKWRRPKGMHSKQRRNLIYRPPKVRIGYRGPKEARGLHPSGFKEVIVHNAKDLDTIDPSAEAARIAHSVGARKRIEIEKKADDKAIRILNRIK
jgi:large subunit ribosomal protein L32e